MMLARFAPRNSIVFAVMTSVAALMAPTLAHADIASDLRNDPSMVLWLDPRDPNGTTLDGQTAVPFPGYVKINTWRDKSLHGNHATSTSGAQYNGRNGMLFDGTVQYDLPIRIYGDTPSNTMEAFIFTRSLNGQPSYGTSRAVALSFVNAAGGQIVFDAGNDSPGQSSHRLVHQSDSLTQGTTVGYILTSYQSPNYLLGQATQTAPDMGALVGYRVNGPGLTMSIQQELRTVATLNGSVPNFSNSPPFSFKLGGHDSTYRYNSNLGTIMIFNRLLNTAERKILGENLALSNRYSSTSLETVSITGLFYRDLVTGSGPFYNWPYQHYRGFLGGIGREADGAVTTGTSAGLRITDVNFLTNGAYLLAAVEILSQSMEVYSGKVLAADSVSYIAGMLPAGYTAASYRRWLIDRTGGSTGSVKMRFNLSAMGVAPQAGQTLGLLSMTNASGLYVERTTAVYDGSGSVEFTLTNPQDGIYAVGIGPTPPPPPSILRTLTSVSQSDGVSNSNFFNLPESVLRQTATFSNRGGSSPTADSVKVDVPVQPNTKLRLADIGAIGSGPVQFVGSTTPPVGLSYTYSGLASTTDSLSFSNDNGATYTYTPVPDADQADANVTHFRVSLPGTFNFSTTTPYPNFTLTYDVKIQ